MSESAALQRVLLATPGLFVLLRPDAGITIVGASAEYHRATHTDASIVGLALFKAFPDNPALEDAVSSRTMRASLKRVRATGQPDGMAVVRSLGRVTTS